MSIFERFFKKERQKLVVDEPPSELPARNDHCWCGSELKYKKCHMEQDKIYLAQKQKESSQKSCSPVFG